MRGNSLYKVVASKPAKAGPPGPQGPRGPAGPPGPTSGTAAPLTKEAVEAVLTDEISTHTHASSGGLTQSQILARQL